MPIGPGRFSFLFHFILDYINYSVKKKKKKKKRACPLPFFQGAPCDADADADARALALRCGSAKNCTCSTRRPLRRLCTHHTTIAPVNGGDAMSAAALPRLPGPVAVGSCLVDDS
jgi:hypothetical protein